MWRLRHKTVVFMGGWVTVDQLTSGESRTGDSKLGNRHPLSGLFVLDAQFHRSYSVRSATFAPTAFARLPVLAGKLWPLLHPEVPERVGYGVN